LPTNLTGFSATVGVVGMLAVVVILWSLPVIIRALASQGLI
jgi:hypothetical protein